MSTDVPPPDPGRPGRWSTVGRSVGRSTGQLARRAARGGLGSLRMVTHGRGAAESGLARVLELHLVSTAADMLIVTALASTIFFSVPTEAARGRVATSLIVTMVPFVVLAPLIGPLLDRVPHGRRYALAATMVLRAWLAWVMADAAAAGNGADASFALYPAAFGFLVCQKAYLVTRAAAVPRLLSGEAGLVAANARVSMAGVVAMLLAAPLGAGLTAWLGPSWTLRLAFVVFAAGTVPALALPARVDSSAGEMAVGDAGDLTPAAGIGVDAADRTARRARASSPRADRPPSRRLGRRVTTALRGNTTLRGFAGFLTLFLAFRLRTEPVGGLDPSVAVAVVLVAAGLGGGIGTVLSSLLHRVRPLVLVSAALGAVTVAAAWAAIAYGLWTVLLVAAVAGLAQALGKVCLDALIQSDVYERVRTSAFARSETVLQLAWVAGGGIGLVLPLSGPWGMGVAATATAVACVLIARPFLRSALR